MASRSLLALSAPMFLASPAGAPAAAPADSPDLSADIAAFEANLAAHASATEALRQWCAARNIAAGQPIRATLVRNHDAPPPADLHHLLALDRHDPANAATGYRHVLLTCGGVVLSEAHNWYVPARLSPEMNRQLAETDTPFGKVAAALAYRRQPLTSPPAIPAPTPTATCPTGAIASHRALLTLPDGSPLALVLECYTVANLRPGPPR